MLCYVVQVEMYLIKVDVPNENLLMQPTVNY